MEPEVQVTRHGGAAVVILNAPQRRNVLSQAMVTAIGDSFDELEADDSVRCVVLTGAGSAFCGGAELSTLEHAATGDFEPVRAVYRGFLRVLDSPLPSIAAINGAAVGAGFNSRWPATCGWQRNRRGSTPASPRCGCTRAEAIPGC
jgi:enoyl-CoA hydratase